MHWTFRSPRIRYWAFRCTHLLFAMVVTEIGISGAYAASFSCAGKLSAVERAICDDSELSKLDERLAAVYQSALAKAKNPGDLRRSQRQWIADREKIAVPVGKGGPVNLHGLRHLYRMRFVEVGAVGMPAEKALGTYTRRVPLESVNPSKAGDYAQYGEHEDYVKLERENDKIRISLWLTYANSHVCRMEADGAWVDNAVLSEQRSQLSDSVCRLRIISDGEAVLLKDEEFGCSRMFCGARGSLDGTIVSGKKR